ncbi:MAG: RluA family pseudouridine synthase [Labilithrix sp.]|nr:RluA family pseudouridine synthase [Labilithrix sp.]MCW5816321.1 RluA family pseudouridine synthase [Labilithrix sp.]
MTDPIVLVVPREADGSRLDRFLASTLSAMEDGPSRTELQRWIENGSVSVDGAIKKASEKLREGARIVVEPEPAPKSEALADASVQFDVVHIDDALIVIDKPAGLVVHPAKGHETGTLVNGLLARGLFDEPDDEDEVNGRPSISFRAVPVTAVTAVAPKVEVILPDGTPSDLDKNRPGIVHRLDKGTSGLMVVARHPRARERLKEQFAEHSIEREYVALVVGALTAKTFSTLHGRHPKDRLRFSSKVKTGKRAVTHVKPLERFGKHATYVSCRLETGRTHQIRVHLADHGTPILGDALYGKPPKSEALKTAAAAIDRPALHARVLGFVHPMTGKTMRFESDPPADFQLALEMLRAIP